MKLEKKNNNNNKTKPTKQSKHRDAAPDSYKVRPETL